jgi:hypothetical protein
VPQSGRHVKIVWARNVAESAASSDMLSGLGVDGLAGGRSLRVRNGGYTQGDGRCTPMNGLATSQSYLTAGK